MVKVEPGNFEMGSDDGYPHEQPVHSVRIARPFVIARTLTTYDEYDRYCDLTGTRRPEQRGPERGRLPVNEIDWYEMVEYCNWLSLQAGLAPCFSGRGRNIACDFNLDGYRLPTEAEWEYAARGGPFGKGYRFAGSDDPQEVAWFADNSGGVLQPVGLKAPNELGLYDMCGNIFEFCWDWYDKAYYASSPEIDPPGPPPPESRVPWEWTKSRRGGSWRESANNIRVASRSFDGIAYVGDNGFRMVRTIAGVA